VLYEKGNEVTVAYLDMDESKCKYSPKRFVNANRLFSSFVFIVLDERTLKDETCRIVSIRTEPTDSEPKDPITLRADFYVAVETLILADVMTIVLNERMEGARDDWREDNGKGEFLYTRQRIIDIMPLGYIPKTYGEPEAVRNS